MSRAETWRVGASALLRATAATVAFLFAASLAHAQAPPPVSTSPSPSVVGREVLPERVTPQRRPDIEVPAGAGLRVPPELLGREVEFHHIVVEGPTAFSPGDLSPLFAPVLNRRVPFSEVVAAINRITALYEKGGYVFYTVVLPQQDLGGDTLRVVVLEGAIGEVEIEGVEQEKVRRRIHDVLAPLLGRRPLRRAELERRLLLAADTPGVALHASAKPDPGGNPSLVTLVVAGNFERFQPIGQLDSFQTTPDTAVAFRVGALGRSLAFGGDMLEARYIFALPWNRLQLFDVRYGVPIGVDGGRLGFLGQAVWQRPPTTINGAPIDYLARSLLGRMQYSYPVVRSLKWTLVGFVMADVIDVDYTLAGIGIPGDSLRVLRGGTSTVFNDEWKGQWNASALASVGLDIASAEANNRFSAGPGFLKANFYLDRLQPFGSGFSAMLRGTAQVTTGTVPAAEVFSVGGRDWARAFYVSQSFADRGAAVSAELRYAPDWLPISPDKAEPYVYLFGDHAWLSSADARNAPFFYEETSAGVGLRLRVLKKYTGEIEVAKALSSPPTYPPDLPWRVSFRIGTPF